MIEPGEVYMADIPDLGRRPVLVVSRESLNRGNRVTAVPFTTRFFVERSKLPGCVPFQAGQFGLTRDCVAQCDALFELPVKWLDLTVGPVGILDDERLRDIVRAIGYVIESECEPM